MHVHTFAGREGDSIDVYLDNDSHGEDAILVGGETGFSCFAEIRNQLPNPRHKLAIAHLSDEMRLSENGAYVAWVSPEVTGGPALVSIQTNRGAFYEAKHEPPTTDAPVWRDFYYRTVFLGLQELSKFWSPADIQFHHPTGSGWPPDLLTVSFEAIRNLAYEESLSFDRINLQECRGSPSTQECQMALNELADVKPDDQVHRPFDWQWKDGGEFFDLRLPSGVHIAKIPLETHITHG